LISRVIFGGERSFKPTSTASRVDIGSFLLHHHPSSTLSTLSQPHAKPGDEPLPYYEGCGLNHQHPGKRRMDSSRPPLSKGMWAGTYSLDGGIGEGET